MVMVTKDHKKNSFPFWESFLKPRRTPTKERESGFPKKISKDVRPVLDRSRKGSRGGWIGIDFDAPPWKH